MRENSRLKFRAWNKKSGKMVDLEKITPFALHPDLNEDGVFLPFNEMFIIEQFTGLKDKNGVDIYESDIVLYDEEHQERFIVIFSGGGFKTKQENGSGVYPFNMRYIDEYEVVGNIHEAKDV